jgi:tetratricopeptide (TPR) repeat protein
MGRRPRPSTSGGDAGGGTGGDVRMPLPPLSEQPHDRVSSESSLAVAVVAGRIGGSGFSGPIAGSAGVLLAEARELAGREKLGEAAAVCERAVAMLTSPESGHSGHAQPETMQAIGLLSRLCYRRGRLDDAAHHANWLLKLKKHTLGEDDVSTADTMFVLGQILKRQGKVDDAVVYLRWALKIREASLGENHLKTALSLLALGNCFMHQASHQPDKLHDARASFLRCLKIRRNHFGVEHVEVIHTP